MLTYKGDGVLELRVHMLKWLCVCLSILILGALAVKYVVGENPLANQDIVTYIIYGLIATAFTWSTLRCGVGTGHVSTATVSYASLKKGEHVEREGWFWSATCISLGLIGTIWGMILMAKSFVGFDPNDDATTQTLISSIGAGMGSALYTTLLGQVCGQILNLQYFALSQTIEKVKNNETSEVQ